MKKIIFSILACGFSLNAYSATMSGACEITTKDKNSNKVVENLVFKEFNPTKYYPGELVEAYSKDRELVFYAIGDHKTQKTYDSAVHFSAITFMVKKVSPDRNAYITVTQPIDQNGNAHFKFTSFPLVDENTKFSCDITVNWPNPVLSL